MAGAGQVAQRSEVIVPVVGMTCASCVRRIEQAIARLAGVEEVAVNLATEQAHVVYDAAQVGPADVVHAIEEAGYRAGVETVSLPVRGMTCASCVRKVETALAQVPGVLQATVNLASEKATVTYLPGTVAPPTLAQAVHDQGYTLELPQAEEDAVDRERTARAAEMRALWLRFLVGAILSVPIFLGSFFPFVRGWLDNPYLLWALATPVQFWVGWRFYRGAWATAKHLSSDMNTLIAVGSSAAYFYSVAAVLFPQFFANQAMNGVISLYFDTAAVIITLIVLGRLLEARAKGQTSEAIRRLMNLQPKMAQWRWCRWTISARCARANRSPWTVRSPRGGARWTNPCSPVRACLWRKSQAIPWPPAP